MCHQFSNPARPVCFNIGSKIWSNGTLSVCANISAKKCASRPAKCANISSTPHSSAWGRRSLSICSSLFGSTSGDISGAARASFGSEQAKACTRTHHYCSLAFPYFDVVKTFQHFAKPYASHLLCFALLAGLSIFFYRNTIAFEPSHIHSWTQGDRYALAIKFADSGLNLFKPRTFNLVTKEGVTAVDLPVHDWAVGMFMKILGSRSPMIFRLYTLAFSILGCWFLFRLTKDMTGSVARGLTAAIFVFTCPIITYYQAGFVPSATSFSAVLMGYYFYFRYQKNLKINDFRWALGLMTLAALSRLPFNIFLFAVLLQQGWNWFENKKIVRNEALAFASAYAVVFVANFYKLWMTKTYGTQFLGGLRPAESIEEFAQILQSVQERWTFQLFSTGHYVLLTAAIFFLVAQLLRKQTEALTRQIFFQSILAIAGGMVYYVLMAQQYVAHEYYFMDSWYPGIALLLVAGLGCVPLHTQMNKVLFGIFVLLCLGCGAWASKKVQDVKYADAPSDWGEITRKSFIGANLLLDSLGVGQEAKILVLDAHSTNLPLIHAYRNGYTLLTTSPKTIPEALQWDFDYIAVLDIFLPSEILFHCPELTRQLERVGGNGRISVFRYNPNGDGAGSIKTLLNIQNTALESALDFEPNGGPAPFWAADFTTVETTHSTVCVVEHDKEFGPTFTVPAAHFDFQRVLFEGSFYTENQSGKVDLIASVEGNGKVFHYFGYPVIWGDGGKWRAFQGLFEMPPNIPPGHELKCYLWNPGGAKVYLDDLKITLY